MRHIDLVQKHKLELVPRYVATITGNNFGDQHIEFRRYQLLETKDIWGKEHKFFGYYTFHFETFPEGEHISDSKIKSIFKGLIK